MATLCVRASAGESTLTTIQAGRHTVRIDEPPFFGGEDQAPSPVEMLLASVAGCVNAIGRYVARERDMSLRGLDIRVEGDCDPGRFFGTSEEQRCGFSALRIHVTADTDAPPGEVEAWREQVLRRCPVIDNLLAPAPLTLEVETQKNAQCD